MAYQSKYYNLDEYDLDSLGHGWTREAFVWIVEQLETSSRGRLLKICDLPEIRLRFSGRNWREETPEEEIVAALVSDFESRILEAALKKTS